ncbi:MAG: hypothetical protein ACRDT4_13790, partial [Micromonosporaceae bacterium]
MTARTRAWPKRPVDELMTAYRAWSGTAHDKGRLLAVVLRNRIEAVVVRIPPTVLAVVPDSNKIERRLMATVGEPGLTRADQDRRLAGACPESRGTWVTIHGELYAAAPTVSVSVGVSGWACRRSASTS